MPRGKYPAKVTDFEIKESGPKAKNPGAEYIQWEFTLSEDAGEYSGRRQWMNTSLLPQALFALKGLLEATGRFTHDQLDGDIEFEPEDVLGADVILDIRIQAETADYDERNEVKKALSVKDSSIKTGPSGSGSLLP